MRPMIFCEKLNELCRVRRWGRADVVAAVPGVSKSTVDNWFKGRTRPDLESARLIARAFRVPLDYLADDAMDDPPGDSLSDPERAALKVVRALGLTEDEVIRRLASAPAPDSAAPTEKARPVAVRDESSLQERKEREGMAKKKQPKNGKR